MAMGPASSLLSLFIDTNIDTHLALVIPPEDTVDDLKGKIRTEHALCFPKVGQVSVEALKVKRRGSLYHLSDSMPLSNAFSDTKGGCFLNADLVLEARSRLHTVCNSTLLAGCGEDRNQNLVANGGPIERALIQTSIVNHHASQTLTDALLQKPSAEGNSLLHDVSSPLKQNLDVSSHKNDGWADADAPEMEVIVENDAAIGSNRKEEKELVVDEGNKEGKKNGNAGARADVGVPVVTSKKDKSGKRAGALQNDQTSEDKAGGPCVEHKKRKMEKDQSSKVNVRDLPAKDNLETASCSKELSQSKQSIEKSYPERQINLIPSEVFPSKPSVDDSSLQQIPTDVKVKKMKKKHLLKDHKASQDEQTHDSLSKTSATPRMRDAEEPQEKGLVNGYGDPRKESDATERNADEVLDRSSAEVGVADPSSRNTRQSGYAIELKSVTSTDFPVQGVNDDNPGGPLPGNSKGLTIKKNATADIGKEAEHNRNHAAVDPEVPSNPRRSRRLSKTEKNAASKEDAKDDFVKPLNGDDIDEAFQNSHAKPSEVSTVAMTDAHQVNTIPTESEVPLEIGSKSSHHSKKKRRERSGMLNSQFDSPDIVYSPSEQVAEDNQNKKLSARQQHFDKDFKGVHVPLDAAAAGNSGLVTSMFPSSSNDKKKNHRKKTSEKVEQDSNLYHTTHETNNSSREQEAEECSKEKSTGPLEHPGKVSMEASVIGKAFENSTIVHSLVPSNPNDKKSNRRKRPEKTELHSGQSIRPKSVHSLGESVTEQNPKESFEGDQNEKSSCHLGCQGEKSKGAGLSREAEIVTNPATGDSMVSLNPSDKKSKRSRKKSGKIELPVKEASKDESLDPLAKGTIKEDTAVTVNAGSSMGENPTSETILRKTAAPESTTELASVITSAGGSGHSCPEEKTRAGNGVMDNSSYCDPDQSSATRHAPENLENVPGNTTKTSDSEHRINSDGTSQDMVCAKPSNPYLVGSDDLPDKHEIGHLSAENANEEMAREETDIEAIQDKSHTMSIGPTQVRDHGKVGESDKIKVDFFKSFDLEENQLEPAKGLSSVETESKKGDKENTKRKKKLNPSPQKSSLLKPAVSEEQYVLKNMPQDNGPGKHSSDDTGVRISKEIKSLKKHVKKVANRTLGSDSDLHDKFSVIASPRNSCDDDRAGKKIKKSNAHLQASLSVDEQSKHPNRKTSMSTGCHSLTQDEHNDFMGYTRAVPYHKNFDASLTESPGGVPLTQSRGHGVANVTAEEDLSGLVAASDSTEEDTPVVRKRFKVAVRKVPHGKVQDKLKEEKASLIPSVTIFDDAISDGSVDEFQITNRHVPTKATSDNSSASDDSDAVIEESQMSYKNSPGAESTDYRISDKGTSSARSSLAKSSDVKRKGKPLSTILKNTSSYKKAKITASQSQIEDSEGTDVIPETQPEFASI